MADPEEIKKSFRLRILDRKMEDAGLKSFTQKDEVIRALRANSGSKDGEKNDGPKLIADTLKTLERPNVVLALVKQKNFDDFVKNAFEPPPISEPLRRIWSAYGNGYKKT